MAGLQLNSFVPCVHPVCTPHVPTIQGDKYQISELSHVLGGEMIHTEQTRYEAELQKTTNIIRADLKALAKGMKLPPIMETSGSTLPDRYSYWI